MTTNTRTEVQYEGNFQNSTAAYARFGRALIENKMRLIDSYFLDGGTAIVRVKGTPANAEKFRQAVNFRDRDFRYLSPTVFDNGTLLPMYASPQDELADRKTRSAEMAIEARQREEDDNAADHYANT